MGLSNSSFYLSWIITYEIIYVLVSLMISGMLKANIFNQSDFSVIFIYHFLFCNVLIFQAIFIRYKIYINPKCFFHAFKNRHHNRDDFLPPSVPLCAAFFGFARRESGAKAGSNAFPAGGGLFRLGRVPTLLISPNRNFLEQSEPPGQ